MTAPTDWARLLKTLQMTGKLRPASTATLDAFEQTNGLKLPVSYRSFCQTFGAGELADWYSIAIPGFGGKPKDRWKYSLKEKTTTYRHSRLEECDYPGDPAQLARAMIFGDDCTGALYFWDPQEATAQRESEFAVYALFGDMSLDRLCDTFADFIAVCLHQHKTKTIYDSPPKMEFRAAR